MIMPLLRKVDAAICETVGCLPSNFPNERVSPVRCHRVQTVEKTLSLYAVILNRRTETSIHPNVWQSNAMDLACELLFDITAQLDSKFQVMCVQMRM